MVDSKTAFFAYPGAQPEVAQPIRSAVRSFNSRSVACRLEAWEQNDVSGLPITDPIFTKISNAEFLAADITFLNENVVFEIGYAIGARKRCLLFLNAALRGDRDLASNIGIFDTLGFEPYDTSNALTDLLLFRTDFSSIPFEVSINHQAPVYIVEPSKKTDAQLMLVSRTKKARWRFRSFNPDEDVRLSAIDAIRHVAQSAGVIALLQPDTILNYREHNVRALFVLGIAAALEIPRLILHPTQYKAPIDIRDMAVKYAHPDDIPDAIQGFSLDITDYIQGSASLTPVAPTVLTSLSIGDPTAENEMATLSEYYIKTHEYQRALRGEVNLIVGRKGSGKTALFVQLRDTKRGNKQNIVVDLKPEGYQLVKLKERLLDFLTVGAQQHLITALWEYILLLEISYKVLEKDRDVHLRDHTLRDPYFRLSYIYGNTNMVQEGDFRERLLGLADTVIEKYLTKYGSADKLDHRLNFTTDQISEVLYQHDIRELYDALVKYLKLKEQIWLLFDNIDKGWSVEGVDPEDILILRCLINASRKLEREFRSKKLSFRSVIFVRDDVYSLLMHGTADYGKEMRASLDWSDGDLLGQVLKRRIAVSLGASGLSEGTMLSDVCVSHYSGEPWLEFMAGRSLMRSRNLLKLFRYAVGYAINIGHNKIGPDDISHALLTYAQDLIIEVNRELIDIFPKAKGLIREFSEENSEFAHDELLILIQLAGLEESDAQRVIDFWLYYGVLGVRKVLEDTMYIYDVNYDLEMLHVRIKKWEKSARYVVTPALWPALRTKHVS
jgi:hypothetical protein